MSLYRREGSPFWQYSFSVNGVRFRGSTGEKVKSDAKRVEAEERTKAAQKRTHTQPWRVREAFGSYWAERGKDLKSEKTVFLQLEKLSAHLGKDLLIDDITNAMLMDYRARRRGEGLKPHTVNRDLATLQALLNHAHDVHGKPLVNIQWKSVKIAEPPHRVRFLSREEYDRLQSVAAPNLRPIIAFAVATGLRKNNILTLDWQKVNMGAGYIEVLVKGNKRGQVRMTASLRALLASMGERKGKVFDTLNFRKRWEKALKDAKLNDFRFHDLRHTFASWARMGGADIADICDALMHSNISVSMRYAHIKPEEHTTAFDRVSDQLWSQNLSQLEEKAS